MFALSLKKGLRPEGLTQSNRCTRARSEPADRGLYTEWSTR